MPLTTKGIAIQILSSLRTQRMHPDQCSVNDCKVVVNHLVRKYSEPLDRLGEAAVLKSRRVLAGEGGDAVRDHAVPVIILVEQLLEWPMEKLEISAENVACLEQFLRDSLLVVEVTRNEDLVLSRRGFQRNMPDGWSTEGHPLYKDPLARYKAAEINV